MSKWRRWWINYLSKTLEAPATAHGKPVDAGIEVIEIGAVHELQQNLFTELDNSLALAKERDEAETENAKLRAALERIVARSHSWVITEATGYIEMPIHEDYRRIAREALGSNGEAE